MSQPVGGFWYHCKMQTIRRSAGRSAVGCAAYRDGERYFDERYGRTRDYTRKKDVVTHFCFARELAPEWAESSKTLWNSAEAKENRINSQVAHEWQIALPAELTDAQREVIARKFCAWLAEEYGVAGSCGIHSGSGKGNDKNDHMHVMMTTRVVGADGWGAKVREFNTRPGVHNPEVDKVRAKVAEIINEALDEAGEGPEQHVDHRSYAERGIDKEPTRHLGMAASAMERRAALGEGFGSERGDWNRAIIEERIAEQELYLQVLARAWDPESAPAELTLATERELERRFGEEWRAAASVAHIEDPEKQLEAAMAPELANLERTGTTTGEAPASLFARLRARFSEMLRDERGEPGDEGGYWQRFLAASRAALGLRDLRRPVGTDEPGAFAADIAAIHAGGAVLGGDFPPDAEEPQGGGFGVERPKTGDPGPRGAGSPAKVDAEEPDNWEPLIEAIDAEHWMDAEPWPEPEEEPHGGDGPAEGGQPEEEPDIDPDIG